MKFRILRALLILLTLLPACATKEKISPMHQFFSELIRIVEADEYDKFIKEYINPQYSDKIISNSTLYERTVAEFKEKKEEVLDAFYTIVREDISPEHDGDKYTFTHPSFPDDISVIRIEDRYYLK